MPSHSFKQKFYKKKRFNQLARKSKVLGNTAKSSKKAKKETSSSFSSLNEDDRTIHTMERVLNIKRDKNKMILPPDFAKDGLDYIFDVLDNVCDDESMEVSEEGSDSLNESSDASETDSEQSNGELEDDNIGIKVAEALSKPDVKHISSKKKILKPASSGLKKYIPPACRNNTDDENKKLERLKRQLKGLVNRLSEVNLQSICFEIESFYKANSRALMTQVLSDVILVQFYTPDSIPERIIMESAMVMTILSHNIGAEIMSYFLEVVCKKLNQLLQSDNYGGGKECNNITQLICSLYQLKIIQKQLILDVIEKLITSFCERDVELLVLILKFVGFQLRKDDPVSLKLIVEKVSLKSTCSKAEQSTRMKFMVEMLTAIKNNNVRKVLDYDPQIIDSRRKKIKLVCHKQGDAFADVKFNDLVNADTQGRWWIVGSSWGGTPMLKCKNEENNVEINVSSKMIKRAKSLRMNTEIRKKIFYAIMCADDYIEGFQNVHQLHLTGKQMREVGYVLMKCCEEQKSFNPFYYHIINKFCHYDKQFIMTIQCSFWDRFKTLDSLSNQQISNIANLLSRLLLSEAVPLSCLKTIEYSEIDKSGVLFLRTVLSNMALLSKSVADIDKVFEKLDSKKYSIVKNGLRLFIQHFMLKDSKFMKENSDLEEALSRMDSKLDAHGRAFVNNKFY